ncbi:hypothetical protein CP8484711_0622B, partial [Chlamydia psittaci 84-8471/1]
YMLSHQHYLFV